MDMKKIRILILYVIALIVIIIQPKSAYLFIGVWGAAALWKRVRHMPIVTAHIRKKKK